MKARLDPNMVAANVARRGFIVRLHLKPYLAIHPDSIATHVSRQGIPAGTSEPVIKMPPERSLQGDGYS
jgi:hypothetical protein